MNPVRKMLSDIETLKKERDDLKAKLSTIKTEHDEEIGEFQNDVQALVSKLSGADVDGSGTDSGDWRDLTLAEIKQGLNKLIEDRDESKRLIDSYEALSDEVGVDFEGVDDVTDVIRLLNQQVADLKAKLSAQEEALQFELDSRKSLVEENDGLKVKLEASEKAAAEMRQLLQEVAELDTGEADCITSDAVKLLQSSDAGANYVHKSELEKYKKDSQRFDWLCKQRRIDFSASYWRPGCQITLRDAIDRAINQSNQEKGEEK